MKNNIYYWLVEEDLAASTSPPDPAIGASLPAGGIPSITNPPQNQDQSQDRQKTSNDEPNIEDDPQSPDMPEEKTSQDFEKWRKKFELESKKADTASMLELLSDIRTEKLSVPQKKFVNDNTNIYKLRENANIDEASKQLRNLIKGQLDKNNPATSLNNHLSTIFEKDQATLLARFHTISGYDAAKGDLHRKYIASLLGAYQVSSGAEKCDIIYTTAEYNIQISTRFNSLFGEVLLGSWELKEDDPKRYLSDPELKRLQDGSPEEKEVLRKRIIIESIASQYEERAFLINVTDEDGTVYGMGLDISNVLRAGYANGNIAVKIRHSDNSEAMIDDDGNIVPMIDLNITYLRDTGDQDEDGRPAKSESIILTRENGKLIFSPSLEIVKSMGSAIQGFSFKEIPWNGNPSDVEALKKCVYSAHDMIMKVCQN